MRCLFLLPALLAAGVFALSGQTPSPTSPSQTPPPQSTSPSSSSQEQKEAPSAPIRVEVNEVIVPVTVTDEKGKFVNDLDEKDFHIFEENQPQKIRFFTRERNQPIVVGFLMDLSNASKVHWKNYQDAAIELIQNLLTGDPKYSGYLISYGNDAELQQNTTSESELLVEKLRKMKPSGGAALYDAVYMACTNRKLVQGEPIEPRRVIVIIGDGHDTASKHNLNEVLETAQRNLVTIYGISTTAFGFDNPDIDNLVHLAVDTGGRVVSPLEDVYKDTDGYLSHPSDDGNYSLRVGTGAYASAVATNMFKAITDIAGEITTQYIIRYIPEVDIKGNNKTFHSVKVIVDLGNVKVRARKGYYTTTP